MFSVRRFTGSSEPGSEPWAVKVIPRANYMAVPLIKGGRHEEATLQ